MIKYSYLTPRKKSPFTPEVQLMVTFFSITLFMLLSTYLFLLYKTYDYTSQKTDLIQEQEQLSLKITQMQSSIVYIHKQKNLAEKVFTQNTVLKDSIENLFDLVPERITLSKAKILKNGLILQGITPNKDIYNFMLEAPLRSIFHRTYSSFYPAHNGWLHFVSTNYIDQEELDSED